MDLAFHLRAERMLNRESAATDDHAVDYELLVATLGAHQSRSATAQAARGHASACAIRSGAGHQVAEIVLGGGRWREAKRAQRGSFHNPSAGESEREPGADHGEKLNRIGTSD
jgi:hypothetical protein